MNRGSCRIEYGKGCGRCIALAVGMCLAIWAVPGTATAQETSTGRAVVTAETKGAEGVSTIPKQSISVYQGRKLQEVSGWTPLRGPRAGLQLVILLDDSSRGNLGLQLNDIRSFLSALPPTTQVAIGYMRNGTPNLVQNFTSDHA